MKTLFLYSMVLLVQWVPPVYAAVNKNNNLTPQPVLSRYALDHYTSRLANSLFQQLSSGTLPHATAPQLSIASFVPLNTLDLHTVSSDERALANQLADSMLSHALSLGYTAYDYRLRNEVLLLSEHEQALSRKVTDVSVSPLSNAILSGSYVVQEDGYVINARIIDVKTKQVLAAVTDYIPGNVFWSEQQVMKRGDYLYRSNKGEK